MVFVRRRQVSSAEMTADVCVTRWCACARVCSVCVWTRVILLHAIAFAAANTQPTICMYPLEILLPKRGTNFGALAPLPTCQTLRQIVWGTQYLHILRSAIRNRFYTYQMIIAQNSVHANREGMWIPHLFYMSFYSFICWFNRVVDKTKLKVNFATCCLVWISSDASNSRDTVRAKHKFVHNDNRSTIWNGNRSRHHYRLQTRDMDFPHFCGDVKKKHFFLQFFPFYFGF